jgi:hypothetical protein
MDSPSLSAAMRTALHAALTGVVAGVLIDSIIVPFAVDRSFVRQHFLAAADGYRQRIRQLQKHQSDAESLAIMARFPSFISDRWLAATGTKLPYCRIEYIGNLDTDRNYTSVHDNQYVYFGINVNGKWPATFVGCPASSHFVICHSKSHPRISTIQDYIETYGTAATKPLLFDFAKTGRIDVDRLIDSTAPSDNEPFWLTFLPVVHAYFRLMQLVRRGACLKNYYGRCDSCHPDKKQVIALAPFPEELYDC